MKNTAMHSVLGTILLLLSLQEAFAGEQNFYARVEGGLSFSRPKIIHSTVGTIASIYDVGPNDELTVEDFDPENNNQATSTTVSDFSSIKRKLRGPHFGIGIGRHLNKHHRIEVDYLHFALKGHKNTDSRAKLKVNGVVAGLYLGTEIDKYLLPYVMGGIGYGKVGFRYTEPANSIDIKLRDKSSHLLQLGLGSLIPINDTIEIDFGYKCTFTKHKLKLSSSNVNEQSIVYDEEDLSYSAFLNNTSTDATFKLRPIHSLFLGLKFNIN